MPPSDRPRTIVVGVDAGGSGARWMAADPVAPSDGPDRPLAEGRVGPVSGLALLAGAGASEREEVHARIARIGAELREALGAEVEVRAAYAGVTGLSAGDGAATTVRDALAAALRAEPDAVQVVSDLELVTRAAFAPGGGIVVYAGTGSAGLYLTEDGRLERVGGHGYLIDDAGGGFWIGRRALRAVLRRADAAHRPSAVGPLADAVYAALGARDWPSVRSAVYRGGRATVASLVPAVGAAHRAGDPDARRIVAEAGRELARLASLLRARHGPALPVALAGGAVRLGTPLRRAVADALGDAELPRRVDTEPVVVAVREARARLRSSLRSSAGPTG